MHVLSICFYHNHTKYALTTAKLKPNFLARAQPDSVHPNHLRFLPASRLRIPAIAACDPTVDILVTSIAQELPLGITTFHHAFTMTIR
jgi:hypothetical protein